MEEHQKSTITKNLVKLVDNTTCTTMLFAIFRAAEIFSKEDVETLEVEGRNRGRFDQAAKFYSIIQTRSNSFNVLISALKDTNQSGAVEVLSSNIHTNNVTTREYKRSPNFMTNFPQNKEDNVLIVHSKDCQITCDRILQTVQNTKYFNTDDALTYFSGANIDTTTDAIAVINCGNKVGIERYVPYNYPGKVVLVTNIKYNDNKRVTSRSVEDTLCWGDLSPRLQAQLSYQLESDLGIEEMKCIDALEQADDATLIELINGRTPKLFKDTIPDSLSFYIPRTLICRLLISNTIFDGNQSDIFLFSDIQRNKLSKLVKSLTVTSSNLLDGSANIHSGKFVILEIEEHYPKLCNKYKQQPIHHLQYREPHFVWLKSKGAITALQRCLQSEQPSIQETEFVRNCIEAKNRLPICLSDSPGMGKSILLSQIARHLKQKTKKIVALVVFGEFIEKVKENATRMETNDAIICSLINYLAKSPIGETMLKNKKNELEEVLFDGFDEISSDDINLGYTCFQVIQSTFKNTRIWVTTRPHMLLGLENSLEVLGYNIAPFCQEDQINFLSLYWSRGDNTLYQINEKLACFAQTCLSTLKDKLYSEDDNIAGIPLQCLLIGEVFEKHALEYFTSSNPDLESATLFLNVHNLVELYEQLVEKKFSNFKERYDKQNIDSSELVKAHVDLSFSLLFPSFRSNFETKLKHILTQKQILDVGIIESQHMSTVRFIHRTFAEYFIAHFLIEMMSKGCPKDMYEFVFHHILETIPVEFKLGVLFKTLEFKNSVTCYFINTKLGSLPNVKHFHSIDQTYLQTLQAVTEACAYNNFQNIFIKFLSDLVKNDNFKTYIYRVKLVFLSTARAGYYMLQNVIENFKSLNIMPLNKTRYLYIPGEENCSILHIAAARGEYSVIEFIVIAGNYKDLMLTSVIYFDSLLHSLSSFASKEDKSVRVKANDIIQYFSNLNENIIVHNCLSLNFSDSNFQLASMLVECAGHLFQSQDNLVNITMKILLLDDDKCNQMLCLLYSDLQFAMTQIKINSPYEQDLLSPNIHTQLYQRVRCRNRSNKILCAFKSEHAINLLRDAVQYSNASEILCSNKTYYTSNLINETFHVLINTQHIKPDCLLKVSEVIFSFGIKVVVFNTFDRSFTPLLKRNANKPLKIYDLTKTFYRIDPILAILLRIMYIANVNENKELHDKSTTSINVQIRDVNRNTLVHLAAQQGNINALKYIFPICTDLNLKNHDNKIPLHVLAFSKKFTMEAWKYMVDNQADVLALDKQMKTPICYLSQQRTGIGLKAILYVLNNINKQTQSNNSAIFNSIMWYVVKSSSVEIVREVHNWYKISVIPQFQDIKVTIDGKEATILDAAFLNNDGDVLELILQDLQCNKNACHVPTQALLYCIADKLVNEVKKIKYITLVVQRYPELVNFKDSYGRTPLSNKFITETLVTHLVDIGADVNLPDYYGNTPLHWAIKHNKMPVSLTKTLIECGANVNTENLDYQTPIQMALELISKTDIYQCIQLLIRNGADISRVDHNGNTFLHILPSKLDFDHYIRIVEYLKLNGERKIFDMKNKKGLNPLQIAKEHFKTRNMDGLISPYNLTTGAGYGSAYSAIHWAAENGDAAVLRNQIKAGVDVNLLDNTGETPVHKAAQQMLSLECWNILIANGGNPLSLNNNQQSPICLLPHSQTYYCSKAIIFVLNSNLLHSSSIIADVILLLFKKHGLATIKTIGIWYQNHLMNPIKELIGYLKGHKATLLDAALQNPDEEVLEYVISDLNSTTLLLSLDPLCIQTCTLSNMPHQTKVKFIKIVSKFSPKLLNQPNETGIVPLSVCNIDPKLVEALVSCGANVNQCDESGNTPLHWALMHANKKAKSLCKALVKSGANVNAINDKKETPLLLAVQLKSQSSILSCIRILVNDKASTIDLDSEGNNILHLLFSKVHPIYYSEVVDYFCEKSLVSLFSQRNNSLLTPIQCIRNFLNPATIKVLQSNGIQIPLVASSMRENVNSKYEGEVFYDFSSETSGSDSDY